jgi:GAF domain-containing protein
MEQLPQESIERLSRVAKLLRTQRTLPARLEAVVAIAKRSIPNCDAAGISLFIEGEPTSVAVTDRLTVEVDLVQYQTGQGPCLAAMSESNIIRIDVLERDSRFTRFAPGALRADINSVLSIPLAAGDRTVGALNLYSHRPNAFNGRAEEAVAPLAEYAAEAITTSPLYAYSLDMVDGLVETLEARALIAQATGVLMANDGRTSHEAMDRIRELAMASGESMRTVAEWVLDERPITPVPPEVDDIDSHQDR